MQLLIVAGYSTFRPFHRDKTLHAALNTVQLKQCVCSLNSVCVADGRLCTLLDNSCYTSRVSHVFQNTKEDLACVHSGKH